MTYRLAIVPVAERDLALPTPRGPGVSALSS